MRDQSKIALNPRTIAIPIEFCKKIYRPLPVQINNRNVKNNESKPRIDKTENTNMRRLRTIPKTTQKAKPTGKRQNKKTITKHNKAATNKFNKHKQSITQTKVRKSQCEIHNEEKQNHTRKRRKRIDVPARIDTIEREKY